MISIKRNAISQLKVFLKSSSIRNARYLCSNKGNKGNTFDQEDQNRHLQTPNENPFKRTFRILNDDIRGMFGGNFVSSGDSQPGNSSRRKSYQEDKFQVSK